MKQIPRERPDSTAFEPADDRLFLQCLERRASAQRRERGSAAFGRPSLWLPRLQRAVRPLRPHHSPDHGRGADRDRLSGRLRLRLARQNSINAAPNSFVRNCNAGLPIDGIRIARCASHLAKLQGLSKTVSNEDESVNTIPHGAYP
jgi:hypothetical protein